MLDLYIIILQNIKICNKMRDITDIYIYITVFHTYITKYLRK